MKAVWHCSRVLSRARIARRTLATAARGNIASSPSEPMPEEQFQFMRDILASPSPVGLEASMTHGVIRPFFEGLGAKELGWKERTFMGNAGTVVSARTASTKLRAGREGTDTLNAQIFRGATRFPDNGLACITTDLQVGRGSFSSP